MEVCCIGNFASCPLLLDKNKCSPCNLPWSQIEAILVVKRPTYLILALATTIKIIMAIFSQQEEFDYRLIYKIPETLRSKYYSSRVSREIFLLDCLNDLTKISFKNDMYQLSRSSLLLRMFIHDSGLEKFYEPYELQFENLRFKCTTDSLTGVPFSNSSLRKI